MHNTSRIACDLISPVKMRDLRLTGAARLREMLADPSKTVVAPGVFDGFTARIALAQGFDCLYMVQIHLDR